MMDWQQRALWLLTGALLPFAFRLLWGKLKGASSKGELYEDSDAVLLNISIGSRWMNMGFWSTPEDTFERAASNLARKVGEKVGLKKGERICDVAYGSGDSILLWCREYAPASVVGITSLAGQHEHALKAVAQSSIDPKLVDLRRGDAAKRVNDLEPSSVSVVVCIDAAYHFRPRDAFLKSAYRALASDGTGRLGLTDLCLPSTPLSFSDAVILRTICFVAGVPWRNLVSQEAYARRLAELGFVDVEIEDISPQVFPGSRAFVARRDTELGAVFNRKWQGMLAYSRAVKWWSGSDGSRSRLHFVLVSARKEKTRLF